MKHAFHAFATPAEQGEQGEEGKKGEAHMGQEEWVTCVLKFYAQARADSDTSDALLDSFRLLAG